MDSSTNSTNEDDVNPSASGDFLSAYRNKVEVLDSAIKQIQQAITPEGTVEIPGELIDDLWHISFCMLSSNPSWGGPEGSLLIPQFHPFRRIRDSSEKGSRESLWFEGDETCTILYLLTAFSEILSKQPLDLESDVTSNDSPDGVDSLKDNEEIATTPKPTGTVIINFFNELADLLYGESDANKIKNMKDINIVTKKLLRRLEEVLEENAGYKPLWALDIAVKNFLKEQVKEKERVIEGLQSKVGVASEILKKTDMKLDSIKARLGEVEVASHNTDCKYAGALANIGIIDKERRSLDEQLQSLRRAKAATDSALVACQLSASDLRDAKNSRDRTIAAKDRRVEELKVSNHQSIAKLQSMFDSSAERHKAAINKKDQELDTMKLSLTNAVSELREFKTLSEEREGKAVEKFKNLVADLKSKKDEIKDCRADYEALNDEVVGLREWKIRKECETSVNEQLGTLREELDSERKRVGELQSELSLVQQSARTSRKREEDLAERAVQKAIAAKQAELQEKTELAELLQTHVSVYEESIRQEWRDNQRLKDRIAELELEAAEVSVKARTEGVKEATGKMQEILGLLNKGSGN